MRIRSFVARWFHLGATVQTRRECVDLLHEIIRQHVPLPGRDMPLARVPLNELTEGQALNLIEQCRAKLVEHTREQLFRAEEELIRARGMGVAVR